MWLVRTIARSLLCAEFFRPQKVIHEDHGSFHSWMTPHNVSKIYNCRIDRGRETDSRIARFVGSGRTMSLEHAIFELTRVFLVGEYREGIVDVTYYHKCANQSLIGCRNKGSFQVVGIFE